MIHCPGWFGVVANNRYLYHEWSHVMHPYNEEVIDFPVCVAVNYWNHAALYLLLYLHFIVVTKFPMAISMYSSYVVQHTSTMHTL